MKKIAFMGVILSIFTLMIGCGGNGETATKQTRPEAYYYFIKYDASKPESSRVEIVEINAKGQENVIATTWGVGAYTKDLGIDSSKGAKLIAKPLIAPTNNHFSGLYDIDPIQQTEVANGSAKLTQIGTIGIAYVIDGKGYFYIHGMTKPYELSVTEPIKYIRTYDFSQWGIIKVTLENGDEYVINAKSGDALARIKDRKLYFYLHDENGIYMGSDFIGLLFPFSTTPGTTPDIYKFCDAKLENCKTFPELRGYTYLAQGPDNIYFYKNIVDETNKKFIREYVTISKADLPDAKVQPVTQEGIAFKEILSFKDAANLSEDADKYLFSNRYFRIGDTISANSLDSYKCTNQNLLTCNNLYGLKYDSANDEYEVISKSYVYSIRRYTLALLSNSIITEKGVIGQAISKIKDNNGKTVATKITINRLFNGNFYTINSFDSSQLAKGPVDPNSFKIRNYALLNGNLYYILYGRTKSEYNGNPKPYPNSLTFTPTPMATIVERGTASYNSKYISCWGTYKEYSDESRTISNLTCIYDENKDGQFGDGNDVICRDDNNNGSFDNGECSYVSERIRIYKICDTKVETTSEALCPNEVKSYKTQENIDFTLWENYILEEIGDEFFASSVAINLITGTEKNISFYVEDAMNDGNNNGFYTGYLVGFTNLGVGFMDNKLRTVIINNYNFYTDPEETIRFSLLLSNGVPAMFVYTYPAIKYYPYGTNEYTESYTLTLFKPGTPSVQVWKDEFKSGNGNLVRIYQPVESLFR